MKKQNPEIKKEARKDKSVESGDLDKAIERIHQKYGNDLEAFFRDVKESIQKRNAELERSKSYVM
jgi:hypothetical protein